MKVNAIVLLSLLLKAVVSIPDADDKLHIYALPVGQGDCTVIQCPRGVDDPVKGIVSIIDAGSSTKDLGINGQDIKDYLEGTRLHYVFLTHADADHLNYMDDILMSRDHEVSVFHSCSWNKYGCYISSLNAVPQTVPHCFNIQSCRKVLNLCPNYQPNINAVNSVKLFFVASAVRGCAGNIANNEDSLIVKITYGQTSTLITGDFELTPNLMAQFLQAAGTDLRSDIYKLSHHGAYNGKANQKEFLNAVSARYVFSSSGYMYGHPRCEIAQYYRSKLPNNVPPHPYTCFYHIGNRQYRPLNMNTRRPIYVTSALKGNFNGWTESHNTVVKINVDIKNNKIDVDLPPLGNEIKIRKKYPNN